MFGRVSPVCFKNELCSSGMGPTGIKSEALNTVFCVVNHLPIVTGRENERRRGMETTSVYLSVDL